MSILKRSFLVAVALTTTALSAAELAKQKSDHSHCPKLCTTNPLLPECGCLPTFHIDIGLLYEQPTMGAMYPAYIYEDIRDETVGGVSYEEDAGNELHPCFDYAIGLTSSLGYYMKHDDWYLGARFDWLSEGITRYYSVVDEPTKSIFLYITFEEEDTYDAFDALYGTPSGGASFTRLTYTASIDIFALDFLLSRGSYHSTYFSYEPFGGVKAIWYYTKQKALVFNADDETGYVQPKQDNWGVGPMFGMNAEFHICEWLSIFSDSDIALLYGEAKETNFALYQDYDGSTLETDTRSTIYDNFDCINYVTARTILGIKLGSYFYHDKNYVAIKLGYDIRSVVTYTEVDRGFTLNGLYADLIWNF